MIDRKIFFDNVRASFGSLNQGQVDGFNALLDAYERDYQWSDLRWLAYALATTWHETAFTVQPIKEYGSQGYLEAKPYYPYYGRGYVQLTWEDNYRKMGTKIGVDLLGPNKDKALLPDVAAEVLFSGMQDGDFTGKSLTDYFDADTDDPRNARRIINGTDKADTIAGYHKSFLSALDAAYIEPILPPAPPPIDLSEYIRRDVIVKALRDAADAIESGKI
jgi:putative chitinase